MSERRKALLCLVGGQTMPNVLPCLDAGFRPDDLVLLETEQTAAQSEQIRAVLQDRGIKVYRERLDNPYDLEGVRERVLDLLTKAPLDGADVALNATGGTKPMSLGAIEVFREVPSPIYYVDGNRMLRLDGRHETVRLQPKHNLKTYLLAHGITIESSLKPEELPKEQREAAIRIGRNARRFQDAIGRLNAVMTKVAQVQEKKDRDHPPRARNRTVHVRTTDDLHLDDTMREYAQVFVDLGFVGWNEAGTRFQLPATLDRWVEAVDFMRGGWAEVYLGNALRNLRGEGVQGIELNVRIERTGVRNELDLAFLANDRIYVIECKTSKLNSKDGTPGADALYKIRALREDLGLTARTMLASARPLGHADRARAEQLGIELLTDSNFDNPEHHLRAWLQKD